MIEKLSAVLSAEPYACVTNSVSPSSRLFLYDLRYVPRGLWISTGLAWAANELYVDIQLGETPLLTSNIVTIAGKMGGGQTVLDIVLDQKRRQILEMELERLIVDAQSEAEFDNLAGSGHVDSIDG